MMDLLEVKNRLFEIRRLHYQKKHIDTNIAVLCYLLEWTIQELERFNVKDRDRNSLPFVSKRTTKINQGTSRRPAAQGSSMGVSGLRHGKRH